MSLNNPTGKESLQVHAKRLREMAESRTLEAHLMKNEVIGLDGNHSVRQYFDRLNAEAAALLAGAEALEALAVIADGEGDAQVIARQALARLEGK
jgi:hypothetical protein